jgi:hypothetical protein
MGIDPNFILWNYFFCVRRPQDLDAELANFVVGACLLMLGPGMASILISTSASQINEGVVEEVVLPKERDLCTAPRVPRLHPHSLPTCRYGVMRKDLQKL